MLHLDILASWSVVVLLVALGVAAKYAEPDLPRIWRVLAEQNGIQRRSVLGSLGLAFVGVAVLAAFGQPLLQYEFLTGDGGLTLWGLGLNLLYLTGCCVAPIVAGNRRLYRAISAADDGAGQRLPQSGFALCSGVARTLDETVTAPWTGADALLYDARETAAFADDLSDSRPARLGYVDSCPFLLQTDTAELVVDPERAAISLEEPDHGAERIESGDRVTVLGAVDHSGTGRSELSVGEGGICYITDLSPEALESKFRPATSRGRIGIGLCTAAPIVVAAYLAL